MSATNSDSVSDSQDIFLLAEKYKTMVVTAREISEIHERRGEWDQAVHLLQCMLEPADKSGDKRIEAEIRVLLGNLLWKRGSFDEARTILQEAEQRAGSDSEILGDCLYHLGELCYVEASVMRKKDLSDALDYHMKACALREKCGDKKGVAQSLSRLGTIHEQLKNQDQALEYHNKAIKAAEEINYDEGLYRPITHIGAFYRRQGDVKTALTYYQRALEICRRIGDNQGLVFALGNVGRTLSDLNRLDDAFTLCREALTIAEGLGFYLAINRTLLILGDLYVKCGDHTEAKELFERLRELAVTTGYEAHRLVAENRIAELEKK